MSSPPMRRADKLMSSTGIDELLCSGYCGHLATVNPDGSPYVCPLLFVWLDGAIWLHNTGAQGHLQSNVRRDPRVCFEVSEPGKVFAYGRFQCDLGGIDAITAFEQISVVARVPDHQVVAPLTEYLVVGVAPCQLVITGAPKKEVVPALPE